MLYLAVISAYPMDYICCKPLASKLALFTPIPNKLGEPVGSLGFWIWGATNYRKFL